MRHHKLDHETIFSNILSNWLNKLWNIHFDQSVGSSQGVNNYCMLCFGWFWVDSVIEQTSIKDSLSRIWCTSQLPTNFITGVRAFKTTIQFMQYWNQKDTIITSYRKFSFYYNHYMMVMQRIWGGIKMEKFSSKIHESVIIP